jgi:hypothetical protein
MKILLRFMVVPLKLNSVIFALELVSSDLVLVRAIFEGLPLDFELDAPAARDHLAAHLVVFCRAERHIWEVCVFNRLLFDGAGIDFQALREIVPSVLNCTIFADCHNDDSNDPSEFFVPAINAYFEPDNVYGQRPKAGFSRNGATTQRKSKDLTLCLCAVAGEILI